MKINSIQCITRLASARKTTLLVGFVAYSILVFCTPDSGLAIDLLFQEKIFYTDNIYADYSKESDIINQFSLTAGDNYLTDSFVFWWQTELSAENYVSWPSESNYLGRLFLKGRKKLASGVIDLQGSYSYNLYPGFTQGLNIDNTSYTHNKINGLLQYRHDTRTSSLYLTYSFADYRFPDYDLDNQSHLGSIRYSLDPTLFTTLEFNVFFLYKTYAERQQYDNSGNKTGEYFADIKPGGKIAVRHYFQPDFQLRAGLAWDYLKSNGNYYYSATNTGSTAGDILIDDFYSRHSFSGELNLIQNLRALQFKTTVKLSVNKYKNRYPFQEDGVPDTSAVRNDTIFTLAEHIEWQMLDNLTLLLYGILRKSSSNCYWQDSQKWEAGLASELWF